MVCKHSQTVKAFLEGNRAESTAIIKWATQSGECGVYYPQMAVVFLKKLIETGMGKNAEGKPAEYQIWSIIMQAGHEDAYVGLMRSPPAGTES